MTFGNLIVMIVVAACIAGAVLYLIAGRRSNRCSCGCDCCCKECGRCIEIKDE